MNNDRRKALQKLVDELEALRSKVEDCQSELDTFKGEEESYRDDMPENLQGGERHSAADAAVDAMQEGYDALDEVLAKFDEAKEKIEAAME